MNRPSQTSASSNFQKWLLQKVLLRLMQNWQWISLFVIVSLAIAFLTNRYSNKIYMSQVKLVKGNDDATSDGAAAFVLGNSLYKSILNTEYEKAFFTSTPLLEEIITDLNLEISYYSKGWVRTYERFGSLPVTLLYEPLNNMIPYDILFTIQPFDENSFYLSADNTEWKPLLDGRLFNFGQEYSVGGFKFLLKKNFPIENRGDWMFRINRVTDLVNFYKNNLRVDVSSQYGQVAMLRLSILSPIPEKDKVVLDRVVDEIRNRDVQRKIESSVRTLGFIDTQLQAVSDSMKYFARKLGDLKLENTELSAGSSSVFDRISQLEDKKAANILGNRYCDYLKQYILSKSKDEIVAPSVVGIDNEMLNKLVGQYIDMRLDAQGKAQMALSSRIYLKEQKDKELELHAFEDVIMESIATTKQSNDMQNAEFDKQIAEYIRSARATLGEEIVYNDNERIYSLNEKVFTMLMDKKSVAGISRAAIISDYRPLEPSSSGLTPLQPKSTRNYLAALVLGLLVPVTFYFQRTLTRNNLLSLTELEEIINIPIIGLIGNNANPTVVKDEPQSLVAENFRTLRSNLKYIKEGSDRLVLLITSSVTNEGKSFVTSNLGYALALQEKKTIVIGADLRKPTLKNYFEKGNNLGLSQYLSGQAEIKDIILQSEDPNLYYIHSGPIPPNPAELISGKRMAELIAILRKDFEYILLDTPPAGTISDATELFDLSDAIILITRQNVTPVAALQQLGHFFDKASLGKTVALFNGVKTSGGYGYYRYRFGYGYGYGEHYRG